MVLLGPRFKLGALLLLTGVGACFLVDGPETSGPHFSHELHGEDKGLHCVTCHSRAYVGASAGLPGPQLCRPCHDRRDEAELPPEERLDAFFDEDGRFKSRRQAPLSDEVVFSHGRHAVAGVTCVGCHGDVGTSAVIPPESMVTKDDCLSCHADNGAPNDCNTCHRQINKGWMPPTHVHAWDGRHGQIVRARDDAIMNRCTMCHQESSCKTCHQETPPRDHTNFWRRRGHGIMASMDRSRCVTCHRAPFCNRCHEGTRPLSHRPSWGDPPNRHCNACHFPLVGTGCITCHKGTPSHDLATPLPPWHNPAMNCRQCHGVGAPLPHPDPGFACTSCHR